MATPHAPPRPQTSGEAGAVLREAERACRELGLSAHTVLVAVSGGLDSVVLGNLLVELAPRLGFQVVVGHVHHGLRGAEADADQAFVAALAATLGVPFEAARVDPQAHQAGRSSRDRPTLQEAARELRYAALEDLAQRLGADRIATAHHADDQAETVLMRLFRGSGPDGLGGIPERSPDGRIVRPLLRLSREALEAFAGARGLLWREDASNASPVYARNRVRAVLPSLSEAFNPRLLRAIADLAEAQRRDSEWIRGLVEQEMHARFSVEGAWLHIDIEGWTDLPVALRRRLAREAMVSTGTGRNVERVHLERMLAFLENPRGGRRIELPGGLILECPSGRVRLGPLRSTPGTSAKTVC